MSTEQEAAIGDALPGGLQAALRAGEPGKALSIIRALPDDLRQGFEVMAQEADLNGKLGRHDEEIALLRQLIAKRPELPGVHVALAHALKTTGRRDDAIAAARAALACQPGHAAAWWIVADFKTYVFDDADVEAMKTALAEQPTQADRMQLHFALGRAFEQRGEYEAAFAHYAAGNAPRAAAGREKAAALTGRVDRAIGIFTPEFFARRQGYGDDSQAPIFIVGLHRSGSTLIEQILASHSQIEATAELPVLEDLLRSVARDSSLPDVPPLARLAYIDAERARELGGEYLRRAQEYRGTGTPRFVDKMPANWLFIGLIRLILPNATIIDARRHPMAAGLSNFRQYFGKGADWTFALDSIGSYYRDYLRLMRHFDGVLPGQIHRVIHDRLVEDFEPEVRRLLHHVGVDFESGCLEFHRASRPVRSASAEQVRRPLNREGVDQWRAFAPWLGPLQEALGDALEDWQS